MQEYIHKCGGKELAKVLYYYGFIPDTKSLEYKIVCPFHKDINPSMKVDLQKGSYFCFGCEESGDAMAFVKGMNPKKNELQSGIEYFRILKSNKVQKVTLTGRTKKRIGSKQAHAEAHDYYFGLSKTDWTSNELDEDAARVKSYMRQRGFASPTLNKCGAKFNYSLSYPIIFPMFDNSDFKGWVCRTDNKVVEQRRKYLYNDGFSKSNTLVGNYGNKDYVIVVEGYMDRLKMLQHLDGIGVQEDVVAILGWKISDEQLRKLKASGIKYVISALDNDTCGKKGTAYLGSKIKTVRFSYLKGVKDPGEMSCNQFEKMYNKTMELAQDRRKR